MNALSSLMKSDDLPVVQFAKPQNGEGFFALENELPQGRRTDRDFAVTSLRPNKNNPAPDFNIRRRFSEVTSFGVHSDSPPRIPERDKNAGQSGLVKALKPLTLIVRRINNCDEARAA